jgi:gamma-glutamyltranspeptidase / glutathione hydrolase
MAAVEGILGNTALVGKGLLAGGTCGATIHDMPDTRPANAAIATPNPAAAAAGRAILLRGGNAVDAAVAAMLTCCVVEPAMVGLGGYGGSMVAFLASPDRGTQAAWVAAPGGRTVAIDFDSRAPLNYRPDLYAADRSNYESGYLSITVPAVVAGLNLALTQFGTLPWSAVSEPAIAHADNGVLVTAKLKVPLTTWANKADPVSRRALLPGETVPGKMEFWDQPDLARLLRRLSAEGPAAFYHGDIPRTIVGQIRDFGGILTERDFSEYRPTLVEPLAIDYRGHRVLTPPPPSGGITSLQILKTLEHFKLSDLPPWSAYYFHLVAEAARLSWIDRAKYLGDPEVTPIPVEDLLSTEAARKKAARIRPDGATPRERDNMNTPSSPHTVNIVVADAAGNVVSMTATHGYLFGSTVAIDGLGLLMNHGMSRFDLTPGSPNAPAPGKRMFHNMAPAIVVSPNGKPRAAVGLPGGPKIVTVTAQLVASLVDFGATPAQAVSAGRIHAEADGPLAVSAAVSDAVVAELRALGHTVRRGQDVGGPPQEIGGPANALVIDAETGAVSAASQSGDAAAVALEFGR